MAPALESCRAGAPPVTPKVTDAVEPARFICLAASARRPTTHTSLTACAVIEIDPDVRWLASPETTQKLHLAFLHAMASRLEYAEGAHSEMMASKNVTLF